MVRNTLRGIILPAALAALAAGAASGQTVPPLATPPPATRLEAADPAAAESRRRDTIRYGIESEIIELAKVLGQEKEIRYCDDLAAILAASRSTRLRSAILELFAGLEWKGGEAAAMAIVEGRDREQPELVATALSYLAAIRSKDALRPAAGIMKEDDKKLLPAVVRLMGRAGGSAEESSLLALLDGDSAGESLRQDAIRALGEIGSAKASERLAAIAQDPEKGKATRMAACEALGKIKDASSVPALVKASNGEDPNVRQSAIEALASFGGKEAEGAIVEALRDSFPKARAAACKAAGARRIAAALPFLKYKAGSDPEKSVRVEAFRALAQLGGEAWAFLRERMDDIKEDSALRVLCFGLLARGDAGPSMPALEARLKSESAEKERSLFTSLAREIANAQDSPGAGRLAQLLLADRDYLIRIAGIEWIRKNKAASLRGELERLSRDDPSEAIRKRAAEVLKDL